MNAMKSLSVVCLGLFLTVSDTFAKPTSTQGTSGMGGGNVVICFKSSSTIEAINKPGHLKGLVLDEHLTDIASIKAYDIYDFTGPIFEIGEKETSWQYIRRVVKRYEIWLPELYQMYKPFLDKFSEKDFVQKKGPFYRLEDENDEGPPNPERCVVATAAVQKEVGAKTRFVFDSRLMNHAAHSRQSQAVLQLHELSYKMFREGYGDKDSLRTRLFVQFLIDGRTRTLAEIEKEMGEIASQVPVIPIWYVEFFYQFRSSASEWRSLELAAACNRAADSMKKQIEFSPRDSLHRAVNNFKAVCSRVETPLIEEIESKYSSLRSDIASAAIEGSKFWEIDSTLRDLFPVFTSVKRTLFRATLEQTVIPAINASRFSDGHKYLLIDAARKDADNYTCERNLPPFSGYPEFCEESSKFTFLALQKIKEDIFIP